MATTVDLSTASVAPAHSAAFLRRRFLNWFPLGLSYALLYMGRYNLNVAKQGLGKLMNEEDFGLIFAAGTIVYGFAFVVNGPLTDRIGGRKAMLISLFGASVANLAMGLYVLDPSSRSNDDLRVWFSVLYAVNMYFQSFGAVAIVKVNASWFHVRERGGFSGIFGTMISSGIFLAYSVNGWLLSTAASVTGQTELQQVKVVFLVPAVALFLFGLVELFALKDKPSEAGQADFDTGDASSGEHGQVGTFTIMRRIFTNPIILTVALIEFCTGVVRQGVMQSYPFFAKNVLALPSNHYMRTGTWSAWWLVVALFAVAAVLFFVGTRNKGSRRGLAFSLGGLVFLMPFLQAGWGGLLFVAGVIGGNVAGHVSDLFFQSRRAPAAGGLYALLFVCTLVMIPTMGQTSTVIDETKVKGLLAGDKLVRVGATGNLQDWVDVSKAFAAIPPKECQAGGVWDASKTMCSRTPLAAVPRYVLPSSDGFIEVELERGGQRLVVKLEDWALFQRPGEPRVLKATPVASPPPWALGLVVFVMSLCVIGIHGLLSGTATMDFGGRKGAATAVGMIDGFVYLGTAVQSVSLGYLTSRNWGYWPYFLAPFSLVGFLLCLRIWNAKPAPKAAPNVPAAPPQQAVNGG